MVHVAILGAYGSAGVAVADELLERTAPEADGPWAGLALEVTLVDGADPGGGLCILEGCMPSKEVLSAGKHRFQARHDPRLEGVPEPDPERIVERKDEHVDGWAGHRTDPVHELAERQNVTFHREDGRFLDDRTIAVGDETVEPDYVVIATGSTLNVPALPGIEDVPFHSSADVLDASTFPASAIVMGFGYVGLELVPYLAEVGGVDLTVIEHDDHPLDEFPAAYGETLLEHYREVFGIEILTNAHERRLERTEDGDVRLALEGEGVPESITAEALYCFTGRRPNLDGLSLSETALEPGPGWVADTMQAVDDERVFVVGDANGREPILHVAKEQGFAAAKNLLRHATGEPLSPYENVPHHVIFSGLGALPFARVGHTPESARDAGIEAPIVVHRAASDDGVFATKNHAEGRATLVVAPDGTVVGWQGLHLHADVMAKTMQVIVELGLDVRDVPDRAYHPTTPEILDGLFRAAAAALQAP